MGGNVNDEGRSIAVDANGSVFTTGYFTGACDFDPGSGSFILNSSGTFGGDIFISKLNASGEFLWTRSAGGTFPDEGSSICVDKNSNVIVTGSFYASGTFGNITLTTLGPVLSPFIVKYDSFGNIIWAKNGSTSMAVSSNSSICSDNNNNVYITGKFFYNITFGSIILYGVGQTHDIFVTKLDPFGNFVWAKQMGGLGQDMGKAIIVDNIGNIYTTGSFNSTADFDPGTDIYNLTSAGGQDYYILKLSQLLVPNVNIVKLPENIYESNYDVLQQSIVHRYYQVRRSGADTPIAGVKLKYKLSNKPNEVFESTVSDAKGVVDLTLRTGGANQIILTDDIIPFGIAPVSISYEKASDAQGNELPVNTNQFLNNDFTVTTYNIQEPEEIEYGVTEGLGGSVGVGYKVGVTVGPIKAEAGLWSASLGGTLGSIVTIKPDANNPNIWTVEGNFTREAELEGSIGPTFVVDVAKAVSVGGGITASASIANGARDFKEYTIDLTNNKHIYFLAHKLLSILANKYNPDILRASNFLKRMSENLVILNQKGKGHSVSADASVGMSLGASIGFSDGPIKASAELGAELAVGIEIENVKSKNLITSENIEESSITAEASASVGLAPILSYDYSSDITFGTKLPTPLFLGASKNYGLTMTKTTLNNNLVGYSSEIASTQNITLGTINYEETISNFTELNGPLTLATTTYYKNNNNGTTSNIYANYLNTGKFGFASFVGGFQNQNNFFTQYVNFNKTAADIFQSSFGLDAFKQGKNRTLTKKQGFNLDFGLSLVLELGLNVNFENWTSFTTPISEHKYLGSIDQIVQTVDRPLSTNFYETPTQTPIQIVFNKVKDALLLEPIAVLTANYGFVQKVFEQISTTASKIYTSLGFSQLNLQAQEVAKITNVDKTSNTNTNPSVLSFTVPPAPTAFASGTEIRFSFYYPENKLKTAIGVDTFQIVSDIFYLNAILNGQRLITASNGNFAVNSTYSTYDLSRASLPLGSMVKLLFMPEGSTQWEVISNVDVSFSTNRLGAYAIAAKLLEDNVPPTINVTNPQSNAPGFTVNIVETQSGINWAATVFKVGGKQVTYQRQGLTNTFSVPISSIIHITDGVYKLEITTADLAGNYTVYSSIYPCEGAFEISSVVTGVPNDYESKGRITTNANIPGGSIIQVKSEKEIIFLPGFEVKDGKSFRASIGGCKSNE